MAPERPVCRRRVSRRISEVSPRALVSNARQPPEPGATLPDEAPLTASSLSLFRVQVLPLEPLRGSLLQLAALLSSQTSG